jgi:nitroreductase
VDIEHLLTTTRSARKSLDLDAPVDVGETFFPATLYGSIFPAVWNFQLTLHIPGYGTCVTTLHLHHRDAVRDLLGIPEPRTQGCLLPVGRLRRRQTIPPARRRPVEEVVAVDSWDGPRL